VGVYLMRAAFTCAYAYMAECIAQSVAHRLRVRFFDVTQRFDAAALGHFHSVDLASRAISDVEGVRSFVDAGIRANAVLAVMPIAFILFAASTLWALGRRLRPIVGLQQGLAMLARVIQESVRAVKFVRTGVLADPQVLVLDAS
jgi:ABC-type multidrug transport system fused ATPase/permease subunit